MPTTVTAAAGDTLCTLATKAGFLNCDTLRADPANASFLSSPLKAGDIVTIPDISILDLSKVVEKLHVFVRGGVPMPSIRFTHGSAHKPYKDDDSLAFLNVSNYIADRGGADGKKAFPKAFGFNQDGDADLDAFKVEVVEPNGGATLLIELEALKPVLDPVSGAVLRHESFAAGTPDLASRKIKVKCEKVKSNTGYKGYRSRYLRLTVDDIDFRALTADPASGDGQALLVTDTADGNNGAADKIEILDQLIRASYVIQGCKAAAPNQCRVVADLPIAPDKQRIKLFFHILRATVGGAGIGGVKSEDVRRRAFKWYRRVFAQAGFGPRLVAPEIEFVDPPGANMLVVSDFHGRNASGTTGAAASTLSFDLADAPGNPAPPMATVNVSINLATVVASAGGPATPDQVAAAVVAALPAGFVGQAHQNGVNHNQVGAAADILITRTDGRRIIIRNETTNDAGGMTVLVPRVNLTAVDDSSTPDIPNAEVRRIVRAAPGQDDQMDCYVFGQFAGGTRGLALTPDSDVPVRNQNKPPMRWATLMATHTMDGTDNNPFTFPHESGHVALDVFHTQVTNATNDRENRELMRSGTSGVNELQGSKRLCDHPLNHKYSMFKPTAPGQASNATQTIRISAVDRLRTRGTNVFAPW